MPVQVFNDHDLILYVRDFDGPDQYPYWNAFLGLAARTNSVDQTYPIDGTEFYIFWGTPRDVDKDTATDADQVILAIQMPDPVDKYGSPVEAVMTGLRIFLCEEEVTDLMEQLSEGKRQLNLVEDDDLEELLKA